MNPPQQGIKTADRAYNLAIKICHSENDTWHGQHRDGKTAEVAELIRSELASIEQENQRLRGEVMRLRDVLGEFKYYAGDPIYWPSQQEFEQALAADTKGGG